MNMIKFLLFVLKLAIFTQGGVLNEYWPNLRIANGISVKDVDEIPFQISLQVHNIHFCGGSILNKNYVVTAAHCLQSKVAKDLEVIVGTVDLEKPYMTHKVDHFTIHEKYRSLDAHDHDIGLIKVKTPFKFSDRVQPVVLPKLHTKIPTNATAVVSGWGRLGGKENIKPTILQKAKNWVVDQEYCRKVMLNGKRSIHPTQICAYDPNTRRGICYGDSGGPLIINGKLIGISSWSPKDPYCASTHYPSVFTRVPEFVDWILQHAV